MAEGFCVRCGQPGDRCDGGQACGRDAGAPPRFCAECGRRLREIVVFPGTTALHCPAHGAPEP